jgi:hypothetical protein
MKMAVFWVLALCSLVEGAASTSETSVNFYQTTQHNNPEDNHHLHSLFSSTVLLISVLPFLKETKFYNDTKQQKTYCFKNYISQK